jgi:hypothetical protein
MSPGALCGQVVNRILGRHAALKSFEREVQAGGGMAGRMDAGMHTVEVRRIVGSVGRAETLRGDFCYRRGRAMTARFHRVGKAMREGKELPPLELYGLTRPPRVPGAAPVSEYYVVDGHHRVAMARKLGQDFLDAHVVAYRLAGPPEHAPPHGTSAPAATRGLVERASERLARW